MNALTASVVIPTYRRPHDLRRCLRAVRGQTRPPDEVVVVRRRDDRETAEVIGSERWKALREVLVERPGQLAALEAGFRIVVGDVVAVTDDDAAPRSDWLERVVAVYEDPSVGMVGGRDVIPRSDGATEELVEDVGRITRWGKLIGNHHRGTGGARDVDVLKGANFSFRRGVYALPVGLRGDGAQVHNEVGPCAYARARGWRLVYDSKIIVDHYPAQRFDADQRERPDPRAVADAAYNLVGSVAASGGTNIRRRAVYGLAVGDRAAPGIGRALLGLLRGEPNVLRRLVPSLIGQLVALYDTAAGRGITMHSVHEEVEPPRGRRRVAVVAHDIHDDGGMERAFAELIRRSSAHVHFVAIACHVAPQLRDFVEWRRVRVPERPFPLRFALFYIFAGLSLRAVQADLLHTCGAIVPNRADLASVHFCHAGFRHATGRLAPTDGSTLRRVNTAITRILSLAAERWSYRPQRTRSLAAVSHGLARELRRHYPEVPVTLTPNGVDVRRFRPVPTARKQLRESERVADGDFVVLFVGGDWYRKGLSTVIRGMALAMGASKTCMRLWVVGRGDEKALRRVDGVDWVRFFGTRDDVERFYCGADVLVLPSMYETFSLVAYEAAATGLPVVATPVSGVDELVGDDEAGIIIDRTPESVAAALRCLADDLELRGRMGSQGRQRSGTFTWDRSVHSVLESYDELLDKSDLPGDHDAV